jgi:hypothetical protein
MRNLKSAIGHPQPIQSHRTLPDGLAGEAALHLAIPIYVNPPSPAAAGLRRDTFYVHLRLVCLRVYSWFLFAVRLAYTMAPPMWPVLMVSCMRS